MDTEQIFEMAEYGAMIVDGFNDCVMGLSLCGQHIIYDLDKIILKLMNDEMSFFEAVEWFDFNINVNEGQPQAPIFLNFPVNDSPPIPKKAIYSKNLGVLYACL
jgi:hypothetical protein